MGIPADGYVHVGDDGVARAYDPEGKVVDYRALTPAQLASLIENELPPALREQKAYFHSTFSGVNGHDITNSSHYLEPPEKLRPIMTPAEAAKLWPASSAQGFAAQEVPRTSPTDEKDVLQARQTEQPLYCLGRLCSTTAACQVLGCAYCGGLDSYVGGGMYVCW
jgi:hypothetical protein